MKSAKHFLVLVLSLGIQYYALGQAVFKEGIIINNQGDSLECLIKDMDWRETPEAIVYKIQGSETTQKVGPTEIKAFTLGGRIFKAYKVKSAFPKIDDAYLNDQAKLNLKEQELFLELLYTGKASLYEYVNSDARWYFYSLDNGEVEQLQYKRYKKVLNGKTRILENNVFRSQLLKNLPVSGLSINSMEKVTYDAKALLIYFEKYNGGSGERVSYVVSEKSEHAKLQYRIGVGMRNGNIQLNNAKAEVATTFDKVQVTALSAEVNYVLPYYNERWAVGVKGSYLLPIEKEGAIEERGIIKEGATSEMTWSSIDAYLFLKYTHQLNTSLQLSVDAGAVLGMNMGVLSPFGDLPFGTSFNPQLGIGMLVKDKIGLQCSLGTARNMMLEYVHWDSKQTYTEIGLYYQFGK
ncbi:hypothetical protein [Algivirga pacifica]|uniref:Outer membrane protein beta-barrel domain-containing protein n=1 Tax=Algivirga pacifica TaxID=1162670 RepID=A0ABP9D627_9BACT